MAFRMSEQPRTIKIYNLLAGTNEFIGEGDAYIPPHTGLPANSTDIAPPDIPAGFVAVFNSDEASWHLVENHRGKTVYDVASGDALFISELGPLPENVTWLSPEGEFQKWNGTAWVKDTEAEKLFRIREAEETKKQPDAGSSERPLRQGAWRRRIWAYCPDAEVLSLPFPRGCADAPGSGWKMPFRWRRNRRKE